MISRKKYFNKEELMKKAVAESDELISILVKSIQTALADLKKETLAKSKAFRAKLT